MASSDLSQYSGSGVLIVDTKTSSLLLVYDYTDNYNCCGGFIKYDSNDLERREKTAQEELYEETRMLISCELDQLVQCPFVDLNFYDEIFRCYILKMKCAPDICQQFAQINIDTLPQEGEDYLETSSMAFFPLKQFKTKKLLAKIDKDAIASSKDGRKNSLNRRVISVIKEAIKQKLL